MVMGCYGIGVSRLIATIVEQHHDEHGIRWPPAVAPYQLHLVAIGGDSSVEAVVTDVERRLEAAGIEVLVDDRDERPGVKFKDADLIGVPLRVTIGGKSLKSGHVELKARSEPDPKQVELLPVETAAERLIERVRSAATAAS